MRNNKHGKKWLRQLALAAGVALACTSQPAHAGFGTAELVSTTISQISDCLDYRILGLSLRVIWTPYGPYYFWTLHVGHTVPAMVNQSHPYLDEMPWEDYSRLLGSAYRAASEAIVHVGFLGLADNVEIGAGRYKHHKFGKHYAPQHYESALIGHPAMIIFQKTGGGEKSGGGNGGGGGSSASSPEKQKAPSNPTNSRYFQGTGNVPRNNSGNAGNGNGQQQPPPGAGFLNRWQNKGSGQGQFTDQERQSLGYDETMSQIDGADYTDYDRANDSVTSAVDGYDVSTGGRYFCTLPYTPFWPYYLSGLDGRWWICTASGIPCGRDRALRPVPAPSCRKPGDTSIRVTARSITLMTPRPRQSSRGADWTFSPTRKLAGSIGRRPPPAGLPGRRCIRSR